MKNTPCISVLTIVYNGERYIEEAIDSILNQTYKEFEYIIVDNNSTDKTPEILESYAKKDKRIKIISEKRQGIRYARNTGLNFSRGKWIAVLDSDDIAMPDRIKLQLDYAEKNPGVVLIGSGCIMIDEFGKHMKTYNYPAAHDLLVKHLENHQAFFPHSSAFVNKVKVGKVGGYRFSQAEDYDLWLRLSLYGDIACMKEPLVKLRRYVYSNSYNINQKYYILFKVVPLICHLRRKEGLSDPADSEDSAWNNFLEWTNKRMENLNCFKKAEAMRELNRIRYSRANNRLYRYYLILLQMLSDRSTISALLEPSYLRNIAERLTIESKSLF